MPSPSRYVVEQLKRFMAKQLRQATTTYKINSEAKPFSSLEVFTGQGICNYEVVATVQHLGTQLVQGHYVAYIKHHNQWILCNDDRITPLGVGSGDPIRNAYLIVLRLMDE